MRSFAFVEPESPRMSFTLDAVENNGLSPSLRRGDRRTDHRGRKKWQQVLPEAPIAIKFKSLSQVRSLLQVDLPAQWL